MMLSTVDVFFFLIAERSKYKAKVYSEFIVKTRNYKQTIKNSFKEKQSCTHFNRKKCSNRH